MAVKNRTCMSCGNKFPANLPVEVGLCISCFHEFVAGGKDERVTLEELRGY